MDVQTVWQCGFGDAGVSTDGGQTWQVTDHDYGGCRAISGIDDKTAWLASSTTVAATADGGVTWTEVTKASSGTRIIAITLRTATEGHVLMSNGALYAMQQDGETWAVQSEMQVDIGSSTLSDSEFAPAAVRFLNADEGVVAIVLRGQKETLIMRTSDGGQTWEQEGSIDGQGALYLSRDGTSLTFSVSRPGGDQIGRFITVLQHE